MPERRRARPGALLAVAALVLAPGCVIVDDGPSTGTITVRWSVEGRFTPSACSFRRAATAQVVVSGYSASTFCSSFVQSVEVPTGRHTLSITLLDSSGRPVSTTINLAADVYYARETFIDTEFPASSFF
jgi:hypothetical protein